MRIVFQMPSPVSSGIVPALIQKDFLAAGEAADAANPNQTGGVWKEPRRDHRRYSHRRCSHVSSSSPCQYSM